jgi:hypothetical protein
MFLFLGMFSPITAQIINFPDANFKARLLESSFNNTIAINFSFSPLVIDNNDDGEIDMQEAAQVAGLSLANSGISDLTGIQSFVNIRYINANGNQLVDVDMNGLMSIANISLASNAIAAFTYDATGVVPGGPLNRIEIVLSGNPLQDVVLQGLTTSVPTNLFMDEIPGQFQINGQLNILGLRPQGAMIDVAIPNFSYLSIEDAPNLMWISIKNGTDTDLTVNNVPLLQYVCTDPIPQEISDITAQYPDLEVNTYCSFVPGGIYYTVNGQVRYDMNGNGCDGGDLNFPSVRLDVTDPIFPYGLLTTEGNYSFSLQSGIHTITPVLENPNYFNIAPTSATVDFPSQTSPLQQNFCVTANGTHADIEIVLVPLNVARPGFESRYKLIYRNKGTVTVSGTVLFSYGGSVVFVSSTPNVGWQGAQIANWDFVNLQPFEQREIIIVMSVNSPTGTPPVTSGDVLHFYASGNTELSDGTPDDNFSFLEQDAVNSFDPNDKICLEGDAIAPNQVGKYVHYQIRFENTGTTNAENIVVKDVIDTNKFDIGSLVAIDGSHNFYTRIYGNKVEFIFENIQLPFDDANNDGYVMFKIRTKPTLAIGDSFSNSASIYFDYNHQIVTEPAVTTIQLLATTGFEFADEFALYPNPANNILNIQSKVDAKIHSIDIYNTLGQLVMAMTDTKNVSKIDVSDLASGNYFIKVTSDKGSSNIRFVKK